MPTSAAPNITGKASSRALRVAHPGLDLGLSVGVAHAAWQRDGAIVGEYVAVQWIERRVVDVGRDDALAQIVEHDDARDAAELAEGALVELRPDAR